MDFKEKLRQLRKIEEYTQKEFSKMIDCGYSILGHYEAGRREPTQTIITNICTLHPEYTLWLMTGQTHPPLQISPEIKTKLYSADKIVARA